MKSKIGVVSMSHKHDGIRRIRTFPFFPTPLTTLSLRSRLWSSENHWDCRSRKQKRKDKPINLNAMLTIRSSKQGKLCHVSSWIARQNNCPEVKVCPRIRISTKQVSFWVRKLRFKSYNLGKPAIQPRYHLRERSNIWYNTMEKIVIECN